MQVPNGELTSEQCRYLGQCVRKYGEKGCLDITTRANIQLRGVTLDDADHIFDGLQEVGLTCVQTGKPCALDFGGGLCWLKGRKWAHLCTG